MNLQLITRTPQATGFDLSTLGMPASLNAQESYQQFPAATVTNFQGLGTSANGDLLVRGDMPDGTNGSDLIGPRIPLSRWRFSYLPLQRIGRSNESHPGVHVRSDLDPTKSVFSKYFARLWYGVAAPRYSDYRIANHTGCHSTSMVLRCRYVQDNWVTKRLTLNLGLRYDIETPYTDRYDRATYFDPKVSSAATAVDPNAIGGLQFVAKDVASRWRFPVNYKNFAPRLGLAYQARPNLVVRAAYGILYQPILTYGFGAANYGTQGYSQTTSMIVSANGGLTPSSYLDNPFPNGFTAPTGNSLGSSTFLGQSVTTQLRYGVKPPMNSNLVLAWNSSLGTL